MNDPNAGAGAASTFITMPDGYTGPIPGSLRLIAELDQRLRSLELKVAGILGEDK